MNRISRRLSVRPTTESYSTTTLMTRSEIIERYDYDPEPEKEKEEEKKMETKDDDAIQMIEDSIEGIKGLDGYKEDDGYNEMVERVLKESRLGPAQFPTPDPINPDQTDNKPRLDHMNDIMRDMRVEMEKREMGEARRVSDAVEQVGNTGECTQKHYKNYCGSDGSDKSVKFTYSNNT